MAAPLDGTPVLARTSYIIAPATLAVMFPSFPCSAVAWLPLSSRSRDSSLRPLRCHPEIPACSARSPSGETTI
jgi:hypothetical protein